VLSKQWMTIASTSLAPLAWGTTYVVTTKLLPTGRPLLDATVRALPAGLILLFLGRQLPQGIWWWRSFVLGALNIGGFFALLFVAATRLPGGVAATVGAIQPMLVTVLAARLVAERITRLRVISGLLGIVGVILVVNETTGRLDLIGVAAALGAAMLMAIGIVLAKRWGQPANPIVTTSWQLVAGGFILLPMTLGVEGLPSFNSLTSRNVAGYSYLVVVGTVLAYTLWFRGIRRLPVSSVGFLGLLSPCMAVACGWLFLHQVLALGQVMGVIIILGAVLSVNWEAQRRSVRPTRTSMPGECCVSDND
jgi:probable blue pigment (indigoidine) exporter